VNFAERFGDPHADITEEPRSPRGAKGSPFASSSPLLMAGGAVSGAPGPCGTTRTTHDQLVHPSNPFHAGHVPVAAPHASPALTCLLWEK